MEIASAGLGYVGLAELKSKEPSFQRDDPVIKRYEMIREYLATGNSAEKVAPRYGYSASSLYYWLKRFKGRGLAGLDDEKTGPRGPNKVTDEMEKRILHLRNAEEMTITKIAEKLSEDGVKLSQGTINTILTKYGIPKKKRGPKPKPRK